MFTEKNKMKKNIKNGQFFIKDLKDIPANIKDNIKIIPVSNIDQVLEHALVRKVKK